jgi:hypothetical protein
MKAGSGYRLCILWRWIHYTGGIAFDPVTPTLRQHFRISLCSHLGSPSLPSRSKALDIHPCATCSEGEPCHKESLPAIWRLKQSLDSHHPSILAHRCTRLLDLRRPLESALFVPEMFRPDKDPVASRPTTSEPLRHLVTPRQPDVQSCSQC